MVEMDEFDGTQGGHQAEGPDLSDFGSPVLLERRLAGLVEEMRRVLGELLYERGGDSQVLLDPMVVEKRLHVLLPGLLACADAPARNVDAAALLGSVRRSSPRHVARNAPPKWAR
jgi:hypothetical protein